MTRLVIVTVLLHGWFSVACASNTLRVCADPTGSGKFRIVMQNSMSVNGLNFVVRYDPGLITPTHVTPLGRASTLTGPGANFFNGDKISFLAYDTGFKRLPPDSGGIFEVTFVVSDSVTDSTSTLIAFVEGMAADSNLATIPFEYVDGFIPISPTVGFRETASTLPRTYQLCQNYPNPFNPTTTIRFDLPKATHVSIKVYNVLGQEVLRVLDDKREAGTYNVRVDGSQMASGVYFYRLDARDFVQTKKMLLIK